MPELTISADWEVLDEGAPEERAAFASVALHFEGSSLTEGHDTFVNRVRTAPLLSAYDLAEWFAWNWWRLRWEPRSGVGDWALAHHMATIGGGYVWPNITIFSDGERIALVAKPTPERATTPFRYLNETTAVVTAREFTNALDQFIEQVRGQLRAEGLDQTNLDVIWNDVRAERRDTESSRRRKLEALLGRDPDELDSSILDKLLLDADVVGQPAIDEVAADHAYGGELLSVEAARAIAESVGSASAPRDMVRLAARSTLPRTGDVPAWRLGAAAARQIREQEGLGNDPITNRKLEKLAGVQSRTLEARTHGPSISFALDDGVNSGRVVLRSKWAAGRRFDLARLIGDRAVSVGGGRLFPATRAHTYRQKMQRAFAAELLSPFDAVDAMLAGDYSMEMQQDTAAHFGVSELTILTMLVNHKRIERDELSGEFERSIL